MTLLLTICSVLAVWALLTVLVVGLLLGDRFWVQLLAPGLDPTTSGIAARMLAEKPTLTPAELESLIVATPSRIFNPDPLHADGKVAFLNDAPAVQSAGGTDKVAPSVAPAAVTAAAPMTSAANRP
jgi:hypothetical protein